MLDISTSEWHLTREKLVQDDAETPNIAAEIARLLQDQLRCHVSECASFFIVELIVVEVACQTKVSYFDSKALAFTRQKYVLVFNVAMHNLLHMDILQTNDHLREDIRRVLRSEDVV